MADWRDVMQARSNTDAAIDAVYASKRINELTPSALVAVAYAIRELSIVIDYNGNGGAKHG